MTLGSVRLYTWIDVEDVLAHQQEAGRWPEWLVWARAYWDALRLGVRAGSVERAHQWLGEILDPRYDAEKSVVLLEAIPEPDHISYPGSGPGSL